MTHPGEAATVLWGLGIWGTFRMGLSSSVFAQVIEPLHRQVFDRNVVRYQGDFRVRTFTCRDQFLCMAFAQLSYRESLRDIESCLRSRGDDLYHMAPRRQGGDYPEKLRRVRFYDEKQSRHLVFLTNNMALPAQVIAKLYKMRWQVEIFFKWIKQHLRIKSFYGTSANAVKTQVWIAVTTYVLVAILKKNLNLESSLHRILQVLSVSLFEQTPLNELLVETDRNNGLSRESNQLTFNDF